MVTNSVATLENASANRPIAYWLFGCAGLVGTMIAVGGATRLTRSGLSMVTWKPHGGLPPMNQQEWEAEFEKYKQFPEYQQRKGMVRYFMCEFITRYINLLDFARHSANLKVFLPGNMAIVCLDVLWGWPMSSH